MVNKFIVIYTNKAGSQCIYPDEFVSDIQAIACRDYLKTKFKEVKIYEQKEI